MSLERLFAKSQIVSLHLPASVETKHLINARSLSAIKRGAWLINTSRGSLVDESAVVEALKDGRLGAAALDVFEEEPVSPSNPLLELPNVVLGAHNGSNTSEAVERTTWLAVDNLIRGLGKESE